MSEPGRVIRMKHFADGHTEEIIEGRPALPAREQQLGRLVEIMRAYGLTSHQADSLFVIGSDMLNAGVRVELP